ncbi:uncharacterized protein N7473_002523 [Penicillium subrubescens]|uniref:uncharacterized protein n=1 Tax=Penicillium subrubescens TaxID=1316194 RepID=UPI0025452015|nr:uncharacterized protein N7473_002523 [Penicillium subrubescens]KAJ5905607.1 hypothetical protein N7473_002523 [Penicillium subrubescens]
MYEEEKNCAGDVERGREEERERMERKGRSNLWRGRGEQAIASSQLADSSTAMGNRRLSGSSLGAALMLWDTNAASHDD